MEAILRAARTYVRVGWSVFTLSPDKVPWPNCQPCWVTCRDTEARENCTCLTCHGFYAATKNLLRLEAMLDAHPRCALAVRTGAASGVVVVDVDVKGGRNGIESIKPWMRTYHDEFTTRHSITVSGGWHIWFKHPMDGTVIRNSVNRLGSGIDVRGDGGYVVVPPTVGYAWPRTRQHVEALRGMSPELVSAIQGLTAKPRAVRSAYGMGEYEGPRLDQLTGAVRYASHGERNALLYWAACRAGEAVLAQHVDEDEAASALASAALDAGLPESEIWRTIRSGLGAAMRT